MIRWQKIMNANDCGADGDEFQPYWLAA